MNPGYGYQLYQAERSMGRADRLTADAQAGRQAAAVTRAARSMARVLGGRLAPKSLLIGQPNEA